jgi:mannose-1-phosphate guanylyltransferase/mannose-6-phosphate isomerase
MDLQGSTLFGQAVVRAAALPGSLAPIVICNEEQRFLAAAVMQQETLAEGRILLEPEGRNTAPAIALGALAALEARPEADPVLLVLSSDHIITPQEGFAETVVLAAAGGDSGRLVVFGVQPTHPETGFGYIKQGGELFQGVFAVGRFVEKPDSRTASAMLDEGGYVWNSGMFMFRASVFLDELARYAPEIHAACLAIWQSRKADLDFMRFSPEAFAACPSVSIDYAVMERTEKACVTPLLATWNDMGSWEAFYGSSDRDENGNARTGDVIELESKNCYLHSNHRLVAAIGLDGISVVETADAVLVMPRERSQDVKLLLEEMKKQERPEIDTHLKVYRPWGSYETLDLGERFHVKRIIVRPDGILSLQKHHHRAEHWVVVRGTAKITVGEKELTLREDESTYIPLGVKHRLENPGCIPLEIIEIQTGSYLGEDDIVRFEDTYGRS